MGLVRRQVVTGFKSGRSWTRGINVYKIDLATARVTNRWNFDTCCGGGEINPTSENQRLTTVLRGQPAGTVMVFAIQGASMTCCCATRDSSSAAPLSLAFAYSAACRYVGPFHASVRNPRAQPYPLPPLTRPSPSSVVLGRRRGRCTAERRKPAAAARLRQQVHHGAYHVPRVVGHDRRAGSRPRHGHGRPRW